MPVQGFSISDFGLQISERCWEALRPESLEARTRGSKEESSKVRRARNHEAGSDEGYKFEFVKLAQIQKMLAILCDA